MASGGGEGSDGREEEASGGDTGRGDDGEAGGRTVPGSRDASKADGGSREGKEGIERMKGMCIYEKNTGLGECAGPIEKVKAAIKRSAEWKGLEGLKARLEKSGEEPGVCKAHEKRAEENGFVREEEPKAPGKKP